MRNPLNFINLTIDHVKARLANSDTFEREIQLLDTVKREIQRLNNLVNSFLEYARPLILKRQKINLVPFLDELVDLIKAKAALAGIHLETEYDSKILIEVDPDLLKTALINIINNSFQAMPEGGFLGIRAAKTGYSENQITENSVQGGYVLIEIEDSGSGIPEDKIDKVFEPFFTTKENGLGLGLPTARRIIEEHGGSLSLRSKVGAGTVVTVKLPAISGN